MGRRAIAAWVAAAGFVLAADRAWADTVPDVVGLAEAPALDMLAAAGFTIEIEYHPSAPVGRVFSQMPGGLADRPSGTTTVRIRVGGEPPAPEPAAAPQPEPDAPRDPRERPDWDPTPLPKPSDTEEEPLGVPDEPPPGGPLPTPEGMPEALPGPPTKTPVDAPPTAPVDAPPTAPGDGTEPLDVVPGSPLASALPEELPSRDGPALPSALGRTENEGEAALARWRVSKEYVLANPNLIGRIVNQFPYPGDTLAPGEVVTIVVAVSRAPTPDHRSVPQLEGLSVERALEEVQRAGLRASLRTLPSSPDQKGTVVSQSPLPNSLAAPGAEVIVRLGRGSAVEPGTSGPEGEGPDTSTSAGTGSTGPVRPPDVSPPVQPPTQPQPPPGPPPEAPSAVEPPVPALGVPGPREPEDGATFPRAYGANFVWTGVPQAQRYEWELQREEEGKWTTADRQVVTETRYRPARMERGRFRWRVRALHGETTGEWTAFSRLYMY